VFPWSLRHSRQWSVARCFGRPSGPRQEKGAIRGGGEEEKTNGRGAAGKGGRPAGKRAGAGNDSRGREDGGQKENPRRQGIRGRARAEVRSAGGQEIRAIHHPAGKAGTEKSGSAQKTAIQSGEEVVEASLEARPHA